MSETPPFSTGPSEQLDPRALASLDASLRAAGRPEVQAACGATDEAEPMGGPVRWPGGFAMPVQLERVLGYGRSFSYWPLLFGLACCAIEMMALGGARFDMARFGMEAMRASPRQADGMIVAGWCTTNMAPRVVRLYEQIPDPKWVLAMGSCAISGNIWDTYNVVQGIDSLIPVDVYVPGCPPRPEALWQGLEMIRERIKQSRHAYDGLRRIPARDAMAAAGPRGDA